MKKLYFIKMHAGMAGTDEAMLEVAEKEDDLWLWERACEHASAYGVYENGDGEFEDENGETGAPECYVEAIITNMKELEAAAQYVLCGNDTFADLVTRLKADGAEIDGI